MLSLYDKCEYGFTFEHPADEDVNRDHCHTYLFNMSIKYDAISERVVKMGYKGNADKMVSGTCGGKKNTRAIDLSGAWCYGSKFGTLRPVFVKEISEEIVEQLNEYSKRMKSVLGKNTVVAANPQVDSPAKMSTKQKTKYTQMKEIAERVISPEFVRIHNQRQRVEIVKRETFAYLKENQIYPGGKYKICELIESVLYDLEDEVFSTAVDRQLEKTLNL